MLSENELLQAIRDCENQPSSYANCQKLAVFYALYNELYGQKDAAPHTVTETVICIDGEKSEFLAAIDGAKSSKIWQIIDELMNTLQVINPRLYDGVMRKIRD